MNKVYSHYTDAELWQRFVDGDKQALAFIYQCQYKPLYKYGYKLSTDKNLIEDCIQDLFMELWKNKSRLGSTDSIRYYLLKSLRRKIFKTIQRNDKTINIESETDDYHFIVEYSIEDLIIFESADAQLKQKLIQALHQLSARQKEAIYLKFYNDMDYKEIAAIMNISYQSIRTLVYQAIKLLRNHISFHLTILSALVSRIL